MTEEEHYWKERNFILTLLDLIPYYIFWKNKDSVFLGCNKNFAEMAGLSSQEDIVGKTDYDLPWEKHESDLYREDDQHVIESKVAKLNIEESQTLLNGRHIILLTNKVPLLNKDGEVIGILGVYNDITERKAMEMELRISKEKSDAANKLKTEFIENMQHDMRTPVSGIYSVLEKLDHSKDQKQIQEMIPVITKSAKALLDLCNDVIDFEKIDYGKSSVKSEIIDLCKLISQMINLNGAAAKAKGIQLYFEIAEGVPCIIKSDEYRIKKILTNLIGNSIKFTKVGEIKVLITSSKIKANHYLIKFDVNDTGIGIPEDKIDLIFEKFTRLNPSNEEIYKGTGLGLSYVKKIIEDLGGLIEVTSKLGSGSNFHVAFPCAAEENNLTKKRIIMNACSFSSDDIKTVNTDKIKIPSVSKKIQADLGLILLIEDQELARFAAKITLEKLGMQILTAGSVLEAKKLLDMTKFNLVISDIGLPDGTGYDIVRSVKSNHLSLNYITPFISLSAHTNEVKKLESIKNGFLDVLEKPLTPESTALLIKTYLVF